MMADQEDCVTRVLWKDANIEDRPCDLGDLWEFGGEVFLLAVHKMQPLPSQGIRGYPHPRYLSEGRWEPYWSRWTKAPILVMRSGICLSNMPNQAGGVGVYVMWNRRYDLGLGHGGAAHLFGHGQG